MIVRSVLLLSLLFTVSFSYLGLRRRRSSCDSVTGGWSGWSVWGKCTCTNNIPSKARYRYCTNPAPTCGGRVCYGESGDTTSCLDLAVQGGWGVWGRWSSCLCDVEGEVKTKERLCDNPTPKCGGSTCEGEATYSETCAIDGGWTGWGNWNTCECDHVTGTGTRSRTRSCTDPVPSCLGRECDGESVEYTPCDDQCCKTEDGGLTDWGDWSTCECDHVTGTGTRSRTRSCTEPVPSCFGRSCDENTLDTGSCNDGCCITEDGNWSVWDEWSEDCECDHVTGEGNYRRSRTCSDPSPFCNGRECVGDSEEVKVCSEDCCKLEDGSWSEWGEWTTECECDHVTGTGHYTRTRTCSDPPPACGGLSCEGSSEETTDCSESSCCKTEDGGLTEWESWGTCNCDFSTGDGTRNRTRSCSDPVPACFGSQCDEEELETGACHEYCCKTVDGGLTVWGDWSTCECDHSTGTGTRSRTRSCTNPSPSCLGRQCEGDFVTIGICNDQCCRTINGGFTVWGDWSTCECDDVTGTGTRSRTRSCTDPLPSCFGSDCIGELDEISSCDDSCEPSEIREEVCDPLLCEKDITCNLDECYVDVDGSISAIIGKVCDLDDIKVAGFCLSLYVVVIIGAVLVLLAILAIGTFIYRRRRSKEVPYVIENVHRTETEDFDEGALTLSDTDVRYRAPCCEADDGDYQIFTNEFALGNDGNDYIERQEIPTAERVPATAERPVSTYVTAYDTVNPAENNTQYENKPEVSSSNENEAGPSSSSYENNIGPNISSYENQAKPSTSSTYENQPSTSSTYENQQSTSSYENQSSVHIKDDIKYENQKESPLSASAIENDDNSIFTPYEDMALRSHQVAKDPVSEEEHHYAEIKPKNQVAKDPIAEKEHHYAEIKPTNQAAEDPVPEEEHHYAEQEEHYAEVRGSVGVYSYAGTTNNPTSNTTTSNSWVERDEELDKKLEEGLEVSCSTEYVDDDHIYFNPDFDRI
ncbi:A disintegrin and metalloproteinase with thrombospondin motifs adt-1-like isoform X2 [Bolinopsis microptera]|uniref:A disintegrin and metalloproteinase with thrombospondin motifs adt-1-like isoform X2 n=1 Tax=Bolinopsis microptera TaxID=2820187 RepID=UPI003079B26C